MKSVSRTKFIFHFNLLNPFHSKSQFKTSRVNFMFKHYWISVCDFHSFLPIFKTKTIEPKAIFVTVGSISVFSVWCRLLWQEQRGNLVVPGLTSATWEMVWANLQIEYDITVFDTQTMRNINVHDILQQWPKYSENKLHWKGLDTSKGSRILNAGAWFDSIYIDVFLHVHY